MTKFAPRQRVRIIRNCEVIGYRLKAGMVGEIYRVTDSLGDPLYLVRFDNEVSLPMRGHELQLVE